MAWGKNGTPDTLTASNANMNVSDLGGSKFNVVLTHTKRASGNTYSTWYFNNENSSSSYSSRQSENGGSDGTRTSANTVFYDMGGDDADKFSITYIFGISSAEKLAIGFGINAGPSAGASGVPERGEFVWKWADTSNTVDRVDNQSGEGTYDIGSNLTVLGSDITPAAAITFPTNVQVGSRAEITDSRKMYNYSDVSTSELKAYYKFDESSGNIINQATSVGSSDSLGTDADMTISGATYSQTGKIGNALSFDGSNDFGTLGSSLSQWNLFHGTGDWTLNYWINFGAFTSEAKIFSNLDSTETRGINVRVGGSDPDGTIGLSIKSDNGFMVNTGSISFNQTLSTGTWYMITLTCDHSLSSANYQVSVNGTGQGTANRSVLGSGNNAEHSTKIMRRGGSSDGFVNADIDEMSIWNRLLTADEITSLYNSNSGRAISSGIFTEWKEIGT
jgi:hypothetical protein